MKRDGFAQGAYVDRSVRELLAGRHRLVEIEPHAAVHVAVSRMCEHNVGALLVCSGAEIDGIFSERDVLRRVVGQLRDPSTTRVDQVMTRDVVTVGLDQTLDACRRLMYARGIRHLPVVKGGRPFAMLSVRDILRSELRAHREQVEVLEHYVFDYR